MGFFMYDYILQFNWIDEFLIENYIIKDEGGLGLYPKSDVVHFDTRGHRARWDSH